MIRTTGKIIVGCPLQLVVVPYGMLILLFFSCFIVQSKGNAGSTSKWATGSTSLLHAALDSALQSWTVHARSSEHLVAMKKYKSGKCLQEKCRKSELL